MENLTITMQLGLTMAGCIFFCFFIGRWIDKWLGTKGVFVTIFTIFGVVGGGVVSYRQIMETIQTDKEKSHSNHNTDD